MDTIYSCYSLQVDAAFLGKDKSKKTVLFITQFSFSDRKLNMFLVFIDKGCQHLLNCNRIAGDNRGGGDVHCTSTVYHGTSTRW